MDKKKALDKVADEIKTCKQCKIDRVGVAVVGEGSPDADVVFIGEAPGRLESETGRPFVGRSGRLLRKLITAAGLKEEHVYITSPVKYLPVYVTPTPLDIMHGKTHLDRQLQIINPKIIVLLGSVAVQGVLGKKVQVSKEHGSTLEQNSKKYFITVHPAAALRFKKFKVLLEEDFGKLKELIS